MQSPYYLLRGGNLFDSSPSFVGSYGYYWSSTPYGSSRAFVLYFTSGLVDAGYGNRYNGDSVRCVAAG